MPRHRPGRQKTLAPWGQLTRARRKRLFIAIKTAIRRRSAYFRGLYDTFDLLTPERGWIDLVFLSRKHKGSYYRARLETAFCRFSQTLSEQALENSSPTGASDHSPAQVLACELARITSEANPGQRHAAFTVEAQRLAESASVSVRESVRIDRSGSDGIGLSAIINAAYLSPEEVERFVADFLDSGEAEWEGSEELSWPAQETRPGLFLNPSRALTWARSAGPRNCWSAIRRATSGRPSPARWPPQPPAPKSPLARGFDGSPRAALPL